MSLGTTNRDGGKTSESGHLRSIYQSFYGEVLGGLAVSQRGAGANMSVDIAIGDAVIPRSDATYGHPSFNDAVLNKTVTAADPTNPRRDIVIMYIDYTVAPSTGVSNNTNGVVLTKVVAGTPAGSPADPTDATLAAAAGSGNPYIKLARIRVGAGVTSLANSVIDDLRTFAHAHANGGWRPLAVAWDTVAYSAWDSTNKLATITVPDSTVFTLGQKFRYWQTTGGWKYGFIVKLASSTSIILYQGTDYTLNNERIYLPQFSKDEAPDGFPRDPDKWTVKVTNTSDTLTAIGTTNVYVNDKSVSISVPIGEWNISMSGHLSKGMTSASSLDAYGGLSTSPTSASDTELIAQNSPFGAYTGAQGIAVTIGPKAINLAAITSYYLVVATRGGGGTVTAGFRGGQQITVIKAVCAYL